MCQFDKNEILLKTFLARLISFLGRRVEAVEAVEALIMLSQLSFILECCLFSPLPLTLYKPGLLNIVGLFHFLHE